MNVLYTDEHEVRVGAVGRDEPMKSTSVKRAGPGQKKINRLSRIDQRLGLYIQSSIFAIGLQYTPARQTGAYIVDRLISFK